MNNFEKRLDEILGSLDIESDMSADDSGNYWIGGKDEAKVAIRTLILQEVIGDSPKNPYGTKDAFMHEWGYQAAKYDEFIRDGMRQKVKGE